MKLYLLSLFTLTLPFWSLAQFEIAHTSLQYTDSSRSKVIPIEVYYPSTLAGEDQPIIQDSLPLVVVAHGFVIGIQDYSYVWEALVPNGYVVALPNTETGISPNHEDFALDINFTALQVTQEFSLSSSVLYGAHHQRTGYIGHSMGGGAVHLAAANNNSVHSLVSLAAAETNPSAIAASQQISIPSLVVAGEEDCVAPANQHQYPMYTNLLSACKTYINILGGGHCNFANDNFLCGLGEQSCGGSPSLDREAQQNITLNYLQQWLDQTLKMNLTEVALNGLESDTQITYETSCGALNVGDIDTSAYKIYPNPSTGFLTIESEIQEEIQIEIFSLQGQLSWKQNAFSNAPLSVQGLPKGMYIIQVHSGEKVRKDLFILR